MSNPTVLLQDLHAPERVAVVDANTAAMTIAGWLAADTASAAIVVSPTVHGLIDALAAENWPRVHALADHLAVSVTVLESAADVAAAERDAAETFADRSHGWGLLGGLS